MNCRYGIALCTRRKVKGHRGRILTVQTYHNLRGQPASFTTQAAQISSWKRVQRLLQFRGGRKVSNQLLDTTLSNPILSNGRRGRYIRSQ